MYFVFNVFYFYSGVGRAHLSLFVLSPEIEDQDDAEKDLLL
jgi:hypothetical protein